MKKRILSLMLFVSIIIGVSELSLEAEISKTIISEEVNLRTGTVFG